MNNKIREACKEFFDSNGGYVTSPAGYFEAGVKWAREQDAKICDKEIMEEKGRTIVTKRTFNTVYRKMAESIRNQNN